jgi:hypothetical protein
MVLQAMTKKGPLEAMKSEFAFLDMGTREFREAIEDKRLHDLAKALEDAAGRQLKTSDAIALGSLLFLADSQEESLIEIAGALYTAAEILDALWQCPAIADSIKTKRELVTY